MKSGATEGFHMNFTVISCERAKCEISLTNPADTTSVVFGAVPQLECAGRGASFSRWTMPLRTFIRANTPHTAQYSISRIYRCMIYKCLQRPQYFKRSGGDSHRARCALGAARVSGGRGSGGATARSPRAAGRAACRPVRGSLGPPRARRAAAVREGCGTKRCSR